MEQLLSFLEQKTIQILTHRKALKAYEKANKVKRTFIGEVKGWADALVFAIFAVLLINQYIFQLFVIPSPSMVPTLKVGDRVFVSKTIYGIEIYPSGPMIFSSNRRPQRDDIITFYNPEYTSKGPFFDILSQIVYMGTFSLVNIDKNEDGSIAERLYVKRAIGFPSEVIRFVDGDIYIRKAGDADFTAETQFRTDLSLIGALILQLIRAFALGEPCSGIRKCWVMPQQPRPIIELSTPVCKAIRTLMIFMLLKWLETEQDISLILPQWLLGAKAARTNEGSMYLSQPFCR